MSELQITNTFKAGNVNGQDAILASLDSNTTANNNDLYWESNMGATSSYGVEVSSANMKGDEAETNMSGLDYTNVWKIIRSEDYISDSYPILRNLSETTQLDLRGLVVYLRLSAQDADTSDSSLTRTRSVTCSSFDSEFSETTLYHTNFPLQWLYNFDGIGKVVEEVRSWNLLELVVRLNKDNVEADIDSMLENSGKISRLTKSEGGFDTVAVGSTASKIDFRSPEGELKNRPMSKWFVNDYDLTTINREGNTFNLELELVPEKEKSFDNEYGTFDSEVNQSKGSSEWLFDLTFGSIATDKVSVDATEVNDGTADVFELEMVLTPIQTRLFEENLSYLNNAKIRDIPDSQDFVDDVSSDNRNTVVIEQPDGADGPIVDGPYTCLDWESEWLSGAYRVTWQIAKQESDADLTIGDSITVTQNSSLKEFTVDERVTTITADMIGAGGGSVTYEQIFDDGTSLELNYPGGNGGRLSAEYDASDVDTISVQAGEAGGLVDNSTSGGGGGVGYFDGGNGANGDTVGGGGGAGSGVIQFDGKNVAAVDGGGGAGGVDSSDGGGGGGGARGGSGVRQGEDGQGTGFGGDGGFPENGGGEGGSEVLDNSVLIEVLNQQTGGGASDTNNGSIDITLR